MGINNPVASFEVMGYDIRLIRRETFWLCTTVEMPYEIKQILFLRKKWEGEKKENE